jgi:hypothetical protein
MRPVPLNSRLAILIWAAMVLVAAQFVAGLASAHPGHAHGNPAVSHLSGAHAIYQSHAQKEAEPAVSKRAELSVVSLDEIELPVSAQTGGCTAGCCGHGIGCCGAALAPVSNSLPESSTRKQIFSFGYDRGSGVDPDALARPPRILG